MPLDTASTASEPSTAAAPAAASGSITLLQDSMTSYGHFDLLLPPVYAQQLLDAGDPWVSWVAAMPLTSGG